MPHRPLRIFLTAAVLLVVARSAQGGTLYVGNDGTDSGGCGPKKFPCRSISQAIANASVGDKILVGPGRYGDLDGSGTPGDSAGEETPAPGCGCMIAMNKNVVILSTNGAAETLIDARTADVNNNVLLITNGGEFGRPGKGFLVTETTHQQGAGIAVDSNNVAIRGNQLIAAHPNAGALGIVAIFPGEVVVIEGNQVVNWNFAINVVGPGKTVRKNVVAMNSTGIQVRDGVMVGNVAIGNASGAGLQPVGTTNALRNAALGNTGPGISISNGFSGVVEKNNLFGNGDCGLFNFGINGAVATDNYWGAATGPTVTDVCNLDIGMATATTVVAPFASKPFKIKPAIVP